MSYELGVMSYELVVPLSPPPPLPQSTQPIYRSRYPKSNVSN